MKKEDGIRPTTILLRLVVLLSQNHQMKEIVVEDGIRMKVDGDNTFPKFEGVEVF